MNLHLEQNVDLLLIENTNLQDQVKSLTKKLATQNQKYNSLTNVLQTQTGFMKEIETKVELISKREKPLREEVERLRRERNDAIGKIYCKLFDAEKQEITASRRRMEEENAWLVEQLHLSRRVGQDMEALVSARMDLQKTRDGQKVPTDLGERIHELHIEKTRLEHDKQDLLQRVNILSKEMKNVLQVAEDWKMKCINTLTIDFNEISVSKALISEKDSLRAKLNSVMNQRTADDRDNEERLKYLQAQIQSLGVMQTHNNLAANNGLTAWPKSDHDHTSQTRASLIGRSSISPDPSKSPKLKNRASFYDRDQDQNESGLGRLSVSNEETARAAENVRDFRPSSNVRDLRGSSNVANIQQAPSPEHSKRASLYQRPNLANIEDSIEEPNFNSKPRGSTYQQAFNGSNFEPKREARASVASPQLTSAMKKPTAVPYNMQNVSPKFQQAEDDFKNDLTNTSSPKQQDSFSKPVSIFQGQTSKLLIPSPKLGADLSQPTNLSPSLSRSSSLKKTRIPSPTRLSRSPSFAESENDNIKGVPLRKSVRARTDSVNSQPSKPRAKHILSGGEVVAIRPRTNSGSGAHLFNGPTPGERARSKSKSNTVQVPSNPFDTEQSLSPSRNETEKSNQSPEEALQTLDSEIKALESLLFK